MRIPSGVTDQYIYFVAVDATDFATRETALSSFTVYRSRNGAAAAVYTTPTVTEVDATNMPGLYKLLVDEDMTIGAGNDSEEIALHITHAGMAPVTRTLELYRPKITVGETLAVSSGAVDDVTLVATTTTNTDMRGTDSAATAANLATVDANVDAILVDTGTTIPATIATIDANVDAVLVDTGTTIPAQISALNDIAATDIVSNGAITTLAGAVVNVDLVDTTTANTDMRGTDSAATASALATVDANVDAILVDTGTTIPGTIATIDGIVDAILVDTNELQTDDIPTTLAGLATAANLAIVDSNVDAILVDTGTTLEGHLTDIKGGTFSGATDSLEALRNRGDAAWVTGAGGTPPQLLQSTTIATLATQVSFTLTAGSADNDAYNGAVAVITDQSTATQKAVAEVSDYVGATKTITLSADPAIFTMATGDTIEIIAALGASGGGTGLTASETRAALGLASANLDTQLSTIDTVVDGIQTDLSNGTDGLGAIKADTAAILVDTNELQTDDVPGLIAALNDIAATDIVSGGAIATTAGAVDNVTLVATTTTNTDMRGTNSAATASALATVDANVDAILVDTNELQADNIPGTLATIAGYIDTEITALISSVNTIDGIVDAILVDTNELQADLADGGRLDLILDAILSDTGTGGVVLNAAERNALADAILDRDMSTGTDSGSASVRTMRQALRFNRNKVTIAGGTLTVTKEDDTTTSHTATVTTAAGDPITTVDPA